jgi:hypothetical protein
MPLQTPGFELPLTSYGSDGQNGRISLAPQTSAGGLAPSEFPGYNHQTTAEPSFEQDMLRGNFESTPVSKSFFSNKNITIIQNSIRRSVFEKSQPKGYVIDEQSVDELKMIMRATFYTYSRNLPTNIEGQVSDLNDRVVQWAVPHILSAVEHYQYYLNDITHLPVPMAQSVNLSRAGTKSLPQNPFM